MLPFRPCHSCVVTLLLVVGLSVGCSRKPEARLPPEDPLARGDWVVVEQTAADFFEGRVLDVLDSKLKLQRSDSGEVIVVRSADVYPLRAKLWQPKLESYAICEVEPHHWLGCQVLRGKADAWIAVDPAHREHTLRQAQVLEPSGLSVMNIRRRFEESGRRQAFEGSVSKAGEPRRVAGWTIAPHRLVLAMRDGNWFGARVIEADEERVVIRWDGQKDETELARAEVMPQPPSCGIPVHGDRALRRPSGFGSPWQPVMIIGVDGAEVKVEDIERRRSTADVGELCPLGEARAPATPTPPSPTPTSSAS